MKSMMFCYDIHSNLLCIVENAAISRISLHKDSFYIYVDAVNYCIKCDWTKSYKMDASKIKEYIKNNTIVILKETTHTSEEQQLVGF